MIQGDKFNKKSFLWRMYTSFYDIFSNYKFEFIISMIGILIASVFFKYVDGLSIQSWALETADAIFRGGYSGFDEIISQNLWNAPHGVVNGTFTISNLGFALWNIPVLIHHYIFKTGYTISFISRMWGKMAFVFLLILLGIFTYKIVLKITNNTKSGCLSAILTWSSMTMMVSVEYAMQNEMVYMLFMFIGIYKAICDKKIEALFWISISCYECPLMLIFAMVIVLFLFKKIIEILCGTFVIMGASLLQMWYINLFFHDISSENEIGKVLNIVSWETGMGKVSILIVIILYVYVLQWSIKWNSSKQKIKYLLWSLSVLSVSVCILGSVSSYRFMICTSFLILNILSLDTIHERKNGIFILLLFDVLRTWVMLTYTAFIRLNSFPNFIKNIFNLDSYPDERLTDILFELFPQISNYTFIICSTAIALGLWMLYLCHPTRRREITCSINIRFLSIVWCCLPIVFVMFVALFLYRINILYTPIQINIYNSENYEITSAIDGENCVKEYYRGKSASKLLVTVIPYIMKKEYPEDQKLKLDIIDVESGKVISSSAYEADKMQNGVKITYHIENVKMKKGQWYCFKFYSPNPIDDIDNYMYLFRSNSRSANPQRHYAEDLSNADDFDIINRIITF